MGMLIGAATGQSLTDRFFDEYYFPFNPTTATSSGIHRYDDKLEDYSKAGNTARITALKKFEAEFAKQPPDADRDLILSYIRSSLLELETVRMWEKNPDLSIPCRAKWRNFTRQKSITPSTVCRAS